MGACHRDVVDAHTEPLSILDDVVMTPALAAALLVGLLAVRDVDDLCATLDSDALLSEGIFNGFRIRVESGAQPCCGSLWVGTVRRKQKHLNQSSLAGECRQTDTGRRGACKTTSANLFPVVAGNE